MKTKYETITRTYERSGREKPFRVYGLNGTFLTDVVTLANVTGLYHDAKRIAFKLLEDDRILKVTVEDNDRILLTLTKEEE